MLRVSTPYEKGGHAAFIKTINTYNVLVGKLQDKQWGLTSYTQLVINDEVESWELLLCWFKTQSGYRRGGLL
jgi:hypothetical protein